MMPSSGMAVVGPWADRLPTVQTLPAGAIPAAPGRSGPARGYLALPLGTLAALAAADDALRNCGPVVDRPSASSGPISIPR